MAQQLSLYFDLQRDELLGLDVAARAGMAWSAAIQEIAAHVDPALSLEVDLESGTKGSLSLNSVVRSVGTYVCSPQTIRIVVVTASLFVLKEAGAWTVGKVLDWLSTDDALEVTRGITEQEREDLANAVVKQLEAKAGRENIKLVFKEANKDRSVVGIGVTTNSKSRPKRIVPRSEFSQRYGDEPVVEGLVETRNPTNRLEVTLIRPVLVNDTGRVWRFRSFTGEFSATIRDTVFLDRSLSGDMEIPLIEGVKLDVLLQAVEEREGGPSSVWKPKSYSILKVYGHALPSRQTSFE